MDGLPVLRQTLQGPRMAPGRIFLTSTGYCEPAVGLDSGLACTWGKTCASQNTPLPTALPWDSLTEFPILGNDKIAYGVTGIFRCARCRVQGSVFTVLCSMS